MLNPSALVLLPFAVMMSFPTAIATGVSAPTSPPCTGALPCIVVIGGGFRGAFIAANIAQQRKNQVLLLEKNPDMLVQAWDDIGLTRAISKYVREEAGTFDATPTESDKQRRSKELEKVLENSRADTVVYAHRVKNRLETQFRVKVELDCAFDNNSIQVNQDDQSLTLQCPSGKVLLKRGHEGANTSALVLIDARSKDSFSLLRDQVKKLLRGPGSTPKDVSALASKDVSLFGYGASGNAIMALPLLFGQQLRIKTRYSPFSDPSNTAQISLRTQDFLQNVFEALSERGSITLNSIPSYNKSKPVTTASVFVNFGPYDAGSNADYSGMETMCKELDNISDGSASCDKFVEDTLAGNTAWCNASAPDATLLYCHSKHSVKFVNRSPNCKLARCAPNSDAAVLATWKAFLDDICPLSADNMNSLRTYVEENYPVACLTKENVKQLQGNDTNKLFAYGRWTYPTLPSAQDLMGDMGHPVPLKDNPPPVKINLTAQPALFYVHLGAARASPPPLRPPLMCPTPRCVAQDTMRRQRTLLCAKPYPTSCKRSR